MRVHVVLSISPLYDSRLSLDSPPVPNIKATGSDDFHGRYGMGGNCWGEMLCVLGKMKNPMMIDPVSRT